MVLFGVDFYHFIGYIKIVIKICNLKERKNQERNKGKSNNNRKERKNRIIVNTHFA